MEFQLGFDLGVDFGLDVDLCLDFGNHRRLQDFTASRANVGLKVGVVKKVGVVMTTPTYHALEF